LSQNKNGQKLVTLLYAPIRVGSLLCKDYAVSTS